MNILLSVEVIKNRKIGIKGWCGERSRRRGRMIGRGGVRSRDKGRIRSAINDRNAYLLSVSDRRCILS